MADKLLTDVLGFFVKSIGGSGTDDNGKVMAFLPSGGIQASSSTGYGIAGRSFETTNTAGGMYAEGVGDAAGILAGTANGIGVIANSSTGTGLVAKSNTGTYVAEFWSGYSGTNQLRVVRSGMSLSWILNTRTLTLNPPASATANRFWNLPDAQGTIALIANQTFTTTTLAGVTTSTGKISSTGQGTLNALGGDGLVTKDLSYKRMIFGANTCRLVFFPTVNSAGGGVASVSSGGFGINSSATLNAYGRAGYNGAVQYSGYTGGASPCSVSLGIGIRGFMITPSSAASSVIRLVVGELGSGMPALPGVQPLTARGFGWEVYNDGAVKIKIFAHNGTTYVESAGVAISLSFDRVAHLIVHSSGAGTIKLFANSAHSTETSDVPLITLAGGPLDGTYGGQYISAYCVTPAAGTASNSAFFAENIIITNGIQL